MSLVSIAVGATLVLVALYDLLATAISVGHGAGPVTGRVANWTWSLLLRIHRRFDTPRALVLGGPIILMVIITLWVLMLIVGWALVFGSPDRLLAVEDGKPVPVLGRVRYAAAIIIGRGGSAVQPAGGAYELLEPIAAMTGLITLSLSIAYVLPVVQGVVAKRSLAVYISMLGTTPSDVLRRAWNGSSLGELDLHLVALAPRVAEVAQSHLAYPVIHFFHSSRRSSALGPGVVTLDRVLTAHGLLDREVRMDPTATDPLRRAIDGFLETLRVAFIEPADIDVGVGDDHMVETLEQLEEAGLPLDPEASNELTEDEVDRNRLLRGYLAHDGWERAADVEE